MRISNFFFIALLLAVGLMASSSAWSQTKTPEKMLLYVGTYTNGDSEGIYLYHLDMATGELERAGVVAGVENPSFLAFHPNQRLLYAVNELTKFKGEDGGAISAFSIDPQSGDLTFLNQQPTHGGLPCHLVVDATGKVVVAVNYSGGNVCVFPISSDGQLGKASDLIQHKRSGPPEPGPIPPHPHSVNLDAGNRFAVVADAGLDKLMVYRLDTGAGKLIANDPPFASQPPRTGPRHFAFHPLGQRFAYTCNETTSSVTALTYDAERGVLQPIHTLSTLPDEFDGHNSTAEVQVHPSGKFVYVSNRGHHSIAIFSVDQETGRLTAAGHASTQGRTPRNFAVDPTGTFLLAENQQTDSIVVFRINPRTGELTPTGHAAEVPSPVCIKMLPLPL
jgi:6-phosphogluconolactonase